MQLFFVQFFLVFVILYVCFVKLMFFFGWYHCICTYFFVYLYSFLIIQLSWYWFISVQYKVLNVHILIKVSDYNIFFQIFDILLNTLEYKCVSEKIWKKLHTNSPRTNIIFETVYLQIFQILSDGSMYLTIVNHILKFQAKILISDAWIYVLIYL